MHHFEHHPQLEQVLYPGLESHPGHAIAKRQMSNGFGGMLSLLVRGGWGCGETGCRFSAGVCPCYSIEGPHSQVPEQLLRLSIGIEEADDLIADLENALAEIE